MTMKKSRMSCRNTCRMAGVKLLATMVPIMALRADIHVVMQTQPPFSQCYSDGDQHGA